MTEDGDRSAWGPALGTLLFVALVPAAAIVYVPWVLSGWTLRPPLLGCPPLRWLGGALIAAGLPVFVDFLVRFVREGRGTPAPVAPPRRLVVRGAFRWSRNPGYLAVLALVAGQALLLGSWPVLAWAAVLAVGFHLFVVLHEEPGLRRRFGAAYEDYCRAVPRWLGRPRRERRP